MVISFVIVNYLVDKELLRCIKSIEKFCDVKGFEIIIVDNSPKKTLKQKLPRRRNIQYIQNKENVGYGSACNMGVEKASGKFVFILNPDTEIIKGSIKQLVNLLKRKKVGAVSPLLMKDRQTPYEKQGVKILTPIRAIFSLTFFGKLFPNNPIRRKYYHNRISTEENMETDILPGTAFVMEKKLYEKFGGFDRNFFLYFEEFDFFRRLKEKGYKMIISPQLKVQHAWGSSTKRAKNIQRTFNKSRFYYFKKHYPLIIAVLSEMLLRIRPFYILFSLLILFSLWIRFYKLSETMIFLGDQGWFYLSALGFLQTGTIPLTGIPSSVVWLHQGPLATYLITLSFLFVGNKPLAPAYLFSLLDVVVVVLVFVIGKKMFGKWVGFLSAFFYASSPLILISARTPYHTSPIPLFLALLLLLIAYFNPKRSKVFTFCIFLVAGLLVQLELSNIIVILILLLIYGFRLVKIERIHFRYIFLGYFIGVLPFVIYDLTHKFVQTLGFPLWIINRARLFLGLTTQQNQTFTNTPQATITIYDQLSAIFSPTSKLVLWFFLVSLIIVAINLSSKSDKKNFFVVLLFTFVPIVTFFIHAAPGVAYFPILFVPISILVGYVALNINNNLKIGVFLLIVICLINSFSMLQNNYFVTTNENLVLPINNYSYGFSYKLADEVASFLIKDSGGKEFSIEGVCLMGMFSSSLDNVKYLIKAKGGLLNEMKTGKEYSIGDASCNLKNVEFRNLIYKVAKNEKNY